MKIIKHRINGSVLGSKNTKYGEIDVHISKDGNVLVKHDPDDVSTTWPHWYFTHYDEFFVDIKQSMSIGHLEKIAEVFKDRLIGLFDLPYPLAFFASLKTSLPIYGRYSHYEPAHFFYNRLWLDPIGNVALSSYHDLIVGSPMNIKDIIIAAPSLHGYPASLDVELFKRLPEYQTIRPISAIVTKYPEELNNEL